MLKQLGRIRVHLIFGGALFVLLLVGIITGMLSGQGFPQALWNAIKEGRPIEWIMIFALWYSLATQNTRDEFNNSRLTTLGLSNQK